MKSPFKVGDTVRCINNLPFHDREVGPPLVDKGIYLVREIVTTKGDNDHLDVGLKSKYNYVSCQATGMHIPRGEEIHWCHPSRFEAHVGETADKEEAAVAVS